ncbi:MAG TPA: tetratricopeptide repeat protein, partial [Pyrinomonadaceae bacterium]
PRERDSFSVAFHEYVHSRLDDYVPNAPVWLNEGLAEFYGSLQFSGGEAVLGVTIPYYMRLLRSQELLPLETLFSIDQRSPHYNEQDKTGIFYGQSWALVHYLMLGGGQARQDQFRRFLQRAGRGDDVTKALEDSFGMSLDTIDKELRAYVRHGELPSLRLTSVNDPQAYASYTAMQRVALSEAEANYYLGDLLLHTGRGEDAERYFKLAIALDPGLTNAYAALGQLAVYQSRFADAKKYLQRATTSPQHYLVHYHYAWLLSRESVSPNGRISGYPLEAAAIMREQLSQTIKLAPNFAPAYFLHAFVDLVTHHNLDQALQMAEKARRLEPARSGNTMLVAQIHVARSDEAAARALLEPLTRDSDPRIKSEAQNLIESLNNGSAGNRSRASVSVPLAAEPVAAGPSRMLGDGSSSSAARDGHTIQNSGSLPTVDEVLARYVEALGGAKAINAVTSRVTKGTIDIPGLSRGGSFEVYQQAPNKSLTVMDAYPLGRVSVGYNGRSGWSQTQQGLQPIKAAAELASLQRDSDIYSPVRAKSNYAKVTLAGTSHIGYREVYVLDLKPAVGAVERLYLDVKTYLPARMNTARKLGAALAPVEVYFDDWQTVDGIKFPFSISQRYDKLTLSFTVKEIRHNVPLDAKMFEPPIK